MRSFRVWLGTAVSLVFLVVAFRGQDVSRIWTALSQANYWYLLPGIAFYFAGVWVRSLRWATLLRSIRRLEARDLFPVVSVGYMANNVLPLRAGEFVRAYALSRRTGVRKSAALGTIAVERVFDGLTMLAFILVASLSIALTAQLRHLLVVGAVLFGVLLGGMALLASERVRLRLVDIAVGRLPQRFGGRVERMAHSFGEGLGSLRSRGALANVGLTSLAAWLLEASMYAMVSEGLGLDLGPAAILLATAVANLATLLPSSPGYVGPFEAGVLLALSGAVGVPRELALSLAVVVHAALYFPITLCGLYYWWRDSLSWRDVRQLSAEEV